MVQTLEKIESKKNQKVIITVLGEFIEGLSNDMEVLKVGLEVYAEENLDFVDCILYAYNRIRGYEIKTFDKKLSRLLKQ